MEDIDDFSLLLRNMADYLLAKDPDESDLLIFRKHNTKLDVFGDLSFPLSIRAWKKHIDLDSLNLRIPLLDIIDVESAEAYGIKNIIDMSEEWAIPITKCVIDKDKKLNIFLDRIIMFISVITDILSKKDKYGSPSNVLNSHIELRTHFSETDLTLIDLTQLRIRLLKDVGTNLLNTNQRVNTDDTIEPEIVYLTHKSHVKNCNKRIVCGVVLSNKFGKKNTAITAKEFYSKRTIDMRLMAQHKYGVRVNSEPGWNDFFDRLGSAAVTFDLLHGRASKTLVINIDNPISSSNKGASFILYNCARLAEIFKQFDKKVASGVYPPLPAIEQINFGLLNQSEEWEILYVYLMQYPEIVQTCVKDLYENKLSVHTLCMFLDSLCSAFSVYYRRVRILTEPRRHLTPTLHSRIYLLKAIQQVLHNALALLNIPPVKQM